MSASALDCCEPGSNVAVAGAKVVKITQNQAQALYAKEIEIYDENDVNVALNGQCFTNFEHSTYYQGTNRLCLNDGKTGTTDPINTDDPNWHCHARSNDSNPNNFFYCVLPHFTNIKSVKVFPMSESNMAYFNGGMTDLTMEIYNYVSGESNTATFSGLLASYNFGFTAGIITPHTQAGNLP